MISSCRSRNAAMTSATASICGKWPTFRITFSPGSDRSGGAAISSASPHNTVQGISGGQGGRDADGDASAPAISLSACRRPSACNDSTKASAIRLVIRLLRMTSLCMTCNAASPSSRLDNLSMKSLSSRPASPARTLGPRLRLPLPKQHRPSRSPFPACW